MSKKFFKKCSKLGIENNEKNKEIHLNQPGRRYFVEKEEQHDPRRLLSRRW